MKLNVNRIDYVHPRLGDKVTAIGGHYVYIKEIRFPYDGREILYFIGYAVLDSGCCGVGGCTCALVPGFIREWKYTHNQDGLAVSRIEPIRNPADQKVIGRFIREKEMVQVVSFE